MRGQLVGGGQAQLALLVEQRLAHGHGHARLGNDAGHQSLDLGVQFAGVHHAVHQTLGQRLISADEVPRHQHLKGLFGADVAHQGHAGCAAEQAVVDAAGGKARLAHRHRQIALRHQLAAGRGGDAVHAGNHRHRQLRDAHHQAAAALEQILVVGQLRPLAHFLEVVARAKSLAAGRQHHGTQAVVSLQRVQGSLQGAQHFFAERVEALRTVQRQRDHTARVALAQYGSRRRAFFQSISAHVPAPDAARRSVRQAAKTPTWASTLRASAPRL